MLEICMINVIFIHQIPTIYFSIVRKVSILMYCLLLVLIVSYFSVEPIFFLSYINTIKDN